MTLPDDAVLVVGKNNRRKRYVPRHYLDNPVLMGPFEQLPSEEQELEPDPDVDVEVDPDDVDAFDLGQPQPLDPPEGHQDLDDHPISDGTPPSDETPA